MKKLLIGCLIVLVMGGVLLTVGGYFLYRAASPVIQNARNYLENLTALGELEKDIANRADFRPPISGELTDEQMQRFVRVQDSVRGELGQRMTAIEEKYKGLKAEADPDEPPPVGQLLTALGEIADVFVQARRYQVAALNQEGFSQKEYTWVRQQVFEAAGLEVAKMVDLRKLEEMARKGTGDDSLRAPELPKIDVPGKNRALVKPYLGRMDTWIPLAFFGL